MMFYSHNLINTYLINIIEKAGGNSSDMGISLSIAAALELPAMAGFSFLVKKFKCNHQELPVPLPISPEVKF